MADQSITIKFRQIGAEKLKRAIENLVDAERELRGETAKVRKEGGMLNTTFKRNQKNAGLLSNAFSTMRSKLLLVNFAMGMGIRQLAKFGEQSAKLQNMETAFNSLSGGAVKAEESLLKLTDATNGTMSNFDLFQQANNAMILGVTKNSDEMSEMFDMAQRLGRALGKDTKESVESLITGIGRQSRLMLDNIGIIVKADEAYKSYADKLGVSVDKLTDAEKKQAFMNATLESAREKLKSLPQETLTTQEQFDKFKASSSNLAAVIGDRLNPSLGESSSFLTNMANKLADMIEITDLERINTLDSHAASLNNTLKQSYEYKQLTKLREELESLDPNTDGGRIAEINKQISKFTTLVMLMDESQALAKINTEISSLNNNLNNMVLAEMPPALVLLSSANPSLLERMNEALSNMPTMEANSVSAKEYLDNLKKIESSSVDFAVNEALRQKEQSKNAFLSSKDTVANMESVVRAKLMEALSGHIASIMTSVPFPGNIILAGGAGLAVNAMYDKAVSGLRTLKFEQGGLVGGRRHSQGGTMIEAEQGEFVMSRSAVEAVGIENMNRINQGGSAVTVNVSGNVMTQDFVEGDLAEAIRNAARRGTDFGVS